MRDTFEELMTEPIAIVRHRSEPLLKEREAFLRYLRDTCGTGLGNIRTTACYLLQIVRLLRLRQLRDVTPQEIEGVASRWIKRRHVYHNCRGGIHAQRHFAWTARRWFRFLGNLKTHRARQPFGWYLNDYVRAMKDEKGLSDATIRGRRFRTREFLNWFAKKHRPLRTVKISDLDSYIFRPSTSRGPVAIKCECGVLRSFFYYAETRRWCAQGIAKEIKAPLLRQDPFENRGLDWCDVIRLLQSTSGVDPADIRAHALLQLFVVYGLRNSEAHKLQLKDIDWTDRVLTVRRAKREGLQQFPLHDAVAKAIRRYIDEVRPTCDCPNVFVTLNGPFRPLIQPTVSAIVNSRMHRIGIIARWHGPQALRHACATRLLALGTPLTEIADFLGHRNDKTVQVYAKLDLAMLGEVSATDLAGAL
jgi:site-specific recombinase XerD